MPDPVWDTLASDTEELVLAGNGLTEVSERIGALRALRMLDLGHNALTSLPDVIGDLPALTDFLYVHDNRLRALPATFARLSRLRYLNASENELTELPACVAGMLSLVELRLSANDLTELPSSIGRLTALRELCLRDNRLATLPRELGALRELRALDLRGNPLERLPDELCELPALEKLDLRWVSALDGSAIPDALVARGCRVYRLAQGERRRRDQRAGVFSSASTAARTASGTGTFSIVR